MHELSLAMSIVQTATELARQEGAARVENVTVRIGHLSCVHEEALRQAFMLTREKTPLAESSLSVIPVPVRIWCPTCHTERELPSMQQFVCPICATPSGDIRAGQELEIESISIDDITLKD
ncbi:MAG: hydrogenase maturation nickel metallochaperone HypA, partial [Planctomycetia bacterium]|nr:hydrogenase maturation nickel metallochaperone HypA [Planctomycetia bacterium]